MKNFFNYFSTQDKDTISIVEEIEWNDVHLVDDKGNKKFIDRKKVSFIYLTSNFDYYSFFIVKFYDRRQNTSKFLKMNLM